MKKDDAVKFDNDKHKHTWRVQRGCVVEWVDGRQKHSGTVHLVISAQGVYGKEPQRVVVEVAEGMFVTVDVDRIRILKTANTVRKDQHKRL